MEALLRHRLPLRRAVVHPSAVAYLDRFSRHPGQVHAWHGHRLFREQPARNADSAALCDRQPAGFQGLRRGMLGHHCQRRTRPRDAEDRWYRTPVLRLRRPRRAVWNRRRYAGAVGRARLAAIRAGNRAAHGAPLYPWAETPRSSSLWFQGEHQPDLCRRRLCQQAEPGARWLGVTVFFRSQPGPDRADDREPSQRHVVGVDAWLSLDRRRSAPRRLRGRLVERGQQVAVVTAVIAPQVVFSSFRHGGKTQWNLAWWDSGAWAPTWRNV